MRIAHRVVLAAVMLFTGAGCGSVVGIGYAAAARPATSTSTPGESVVNAGGRSAAPRCTTRQLTISRHGRDGGAGNQADQLFFRNHGAACTLAGYPEVLLLDRDGRVVGRPQRTRSGYLGGLGWQHRHHAPPVVLLDRGRFANATIDGLTGPADNRPCPRYIAYRVTPPGAAGSVRVPAGEAPGFCVRSVHPIVPGGAHTFPRSHD